jgi:hypothetical protein
MSDLNHSPNENRQIDSDYIINFIVGFALTAVFIAVMNWLL